MEKRRSVFERIKWAVLGLFGVKRPKPKPVASIEQPENGIYPLW